jgi:aromatic-L-amino-acid decarboxylase
MHKDNLGDVPSDEFRRQLHALADWIADYRETIEQRRIAPNEKPGAVVARLEKEPPETARSLDGILADFDNVIVPGLAHWAHPQFMSYFGCTTTNPGVLAEILTGALNVNAMTWRTSPAATELETLVLDWLRQWLGLPEVYQGVVYDTASISTMHALACAREQVAPQTRNLGLSARDLPRLRIYTSEQAHSSVEKGAIAIGVGHENVVRLPVDSEFRMNVAALRERVALDLRGGFKPMAVVATVGTTSTTSVDPVAQIAPVCREHKMWLHIDGAYGAGLALLPECHWITQGWSEADSLVINPHKMLFVPFDFSALYLRDLEKMRRLFTLAPEYLHLRGAGDAEINYMDYGVQLGRRFRALKAWIVWQTFGRQGIAARIREHLRLAHLFATWVKADARFEVAAPTVMAVVCFRLLGSSSDESDRLNSAIVEKINASGKAYLTQTKLNGRTTMRIGLGNILTTEDHLRKVWDLVRETAESS